MKNKILLLIVEGPSDADALSIPLENRLVDEKIKMSVKIMHGDILTEFKQEKKEYKINSSNVFGEFKKLLKNFLEKNTLIKQKDIGKIIYITDTDNCFLGKEEHHMNKASCLKVLFNHEILSKGNNKTDKNISFNIIFMGENLEHVLTKNLKNFSNTEKEKIATDFSNKCENNFQFFKDTFYDSSLKTWDTYKESYVKIQTCTERSSNLNNLLNELEI